MTQVCRAILGQPRLRARHFSPVKWVEQLAEVTAWDLLNEPKRVRFRWWATVGSKRQIHER